MKKKILLSLLVIVGLFLVTACDNESKNNKLSNNNGIVAGTYKAFKTVQYGVESTEEEIKKEGWDVTLTVKSNKIAIFNWKNTKNNDTTVINFTIKNKKLIDDKTGDEYSYSYVNGIITIKGEDGTSWSFK